MSCAPMTTAMPLERPSSRKVGNCSIGGSCGNSSRNNYTRRRGFFGQGRAAHCRGEKAEHAADPDPRQFGIAGVMLQDQRAIGCRIVQPGADRDATGERIGPGLGQTIRMWVWKVVRMLMVVLLSDWPNSFSAFGL